MTHTTNYNLNKPATTDPVLVSDFNENFDIIDSALTEKANVSSVYTKAQTDARIPQIDKTLKNSGQAADAKTVGATLGNAFNISVSASDWENGGISAAGAEPASPYVIRTSKYYPCENIYSCGFTGIRISVGESLDRAVQYAFYDDDLNFVKRTNAVWESGHAYVRFCYGFQTSSGIKVADYGFEQLISDFSVTTFQSHPLVTNFLGGTKLADQPMNTICRVASSTMSNCTDKPNGISGETYLETIGGTSYGYQRIITTTAEYHRMRNSNNWTSWYVSNFTKVT